MLRGILRLSTTALSPLLSSSNSGLKLGEEPRFFGTFQNRAKVVDSFCGDGSCLAGGFLKTVNWNLNGAVISRHFCGADIGIRPIGVADAICILVWALGGLAPTSSTEPVTTISNGR